MRALPIIVSSDPGLKLGAQCLPIDVVATQPVRFNYVQCFLEIRTLVLDSPRAIRSIPVTSPGDWDDYGQKDNCTVSQTASGLFNEHCGTRQLLARC